MKKIIIFSLTLIFAITGITRAQTYTWSVGATGGSPLQFDACARENTIIDRNPTISKEWQGADVALAGSLPEFGERQALGFKCDNYPTLWRMPDGQVRLYYSILADSGWRIKCRISSDDGMNWGPEIDVVQGMCSSLYIMSAGKYRLYTIDAAEAGYRESSDGLTAWTEFKSLNLGERADDIFVYKTSSGFIAYYSQLNLSPYYYQMKYAISSDGASFTNAKLINLQYTSTNSALGPFLWPLDNGSFRLYYFWYNGTYKQLAYLETSDGMNFSSSQQVLLGIGSNNDHAACPFLFRDLQGDLRLYYIWTNKDRTVSQLSFQPTSFDFTGWKRADNEWKIGAGANDDAHGWPCIFRMEDGSYRMYYSWGNGAYWQIVYRVSLDMDNWSSHITTGIGTSATDDALEPFLYLMPNGTYRLYYQRDKHSGSNDHEIICRASDDLDQWEDKEPIDFGIGGSGDNKATGPFVYYSKDKERPYYLYRSWYNGSYGQMMYHTSVDGVTNWSDAIPLHIGTGTTDQALRGFLYKDDTGTYTIIYDWHDGNYWQLATQNSSDGISNWEERKLLGIRHDQNSSKQAYCPWLYRLEDGTYRLYYTTHDGYDYISYYSHPGVHVSQGTITNNPADAGDIKQWTKISWEKVLPKDTDIYFYTRTGNTPTADVTWSGWAGPYANASGSSITSPPGQYFQWKAELKTEDWKSTPRLQSVTIENAEYIPPTPTPIATPTPGPDKQIRSFPSRINPEKGEHTTIRWYQAESCNTTIKLYNLRGELIKTLADNVYYPKGQLHEIIWRGLNASGSTVASGIYIAHIRAGDYEDRIKVGVIK